jgi:hypothetical protein
MTSPKPETVSSILFRWVGRVVLAVFFLMLTVAVASPPVRAQSASPEPRTPKSETQAKKPRPAVAGQTGKPAGVKAKPRVRGTAKAAKPADESAAQSSPESNEKAAATPLVRTAESVDFDADADEVQKLEPSLELIQASPRRARHRSLVPASPKPEDSVVGRE